ncbi:hypothetical protein HGH93_27655 [Chitinophaga polysaccharea]|uniref:hypothetical protein n=1 Tax=Chitinophaga TaxID=79328 RepID=UPI00145515E6|nr:MULTISPECIES: hypothetical protein [Chitinophaga]NLR61902.1 hypothetical protein [Chitinophaga polysaccharea]NLU94451.1 hypothetical protein [Chitinophaga sp. Ak27]
MKSSKKGLYLSVPTPCEENWNDMPLSADGRRCGSCQKTVVDFSLLSDAEIFAVITNSKGTVCGHFVPSQLERAIMPGVPARHYSVPAMLLSAGLTLGIVTTGHTESRELERVEVGIVPAAKDSALPNAKIKQLPEVVVTSYATRKTSSVTGAVCVIEGATIKPPKQENEPMYYSGRSISLRGNEQQAPAQEEKKKKRFLFFK